jgi:nickel-dependent lactate racemase
MVVSWLTVVYKMLNGYGSTLQYLAPKDIQEILEYSFYQWELSNKKVLLVIPDNTRTAPMHLFLELILNSWYRKAKKVDFLIALGTHPPLAEKMMERLLGYSTADIQKQWPGTQVFNHQWDRSDVFSEIGKITAAQSLQLSDGLLSIEVPVKINKKILEYDAVVICGPVFPHEVVGFSGGNKYFFPGISSAEIINYSHWLGALLTSEAIIGRKDTPVRKVINLAAGMIPVQNFAICFVVGNTGIQALFSGSPEVAWSAAADFSAKIHIKHLPRPVSKVLAILPEMYSDLWVGGKGMYKTDPIVKDGGEVILFAPHIHEISKTHGEFLLKIGYHIRDYFLSRWDHYSQYPWGILAHSTHVKGRGIYENGLELPRIQVTVASSIPADIIKQVNLNYQDPEKINAQEWMNKQGEDILVVPHAGEILYRLL